MQDTSILNTFKEKKEVNVVFGVLCSVVECSVSNVTLIYQTCQTYMNSNHCICSYEFLIRISNTMLTKNLDSKYNGDVCTRIPFIDKRESRKINNRKRKPKIGLEHYLDTVL